MLRVKRIMIQIPALNRYFEAGKVTRSELGPQYKLSEKTLRNRPFPWRSLTQYRSRFSRTHSSLSRKRWESCCENPVFPPTSKRGEITPALSSTPQDNW